MRTPSVDEPSPSRFRPWHWPLLALLVVASWLIIQRHQPATVPFQANEGYIFGTVFHVKYQHTEDLTSDILAELNRVDASLSMFNPESTISRINRGEQTQTDALMDSLWLIVEQVAEATGGAFDPTCAPLVNAWGFGFKHDTLPTDHEVDSLKALVGWRRIRMADGECQKEDPRMVLDFSAVAKGYAVDRVALLLGSKGIDNFMVEIGGEVVTHGINDKGTDWRIGVNKPIEDSTSTNNELQRVFDLHNEAVATSGNYRNFYMHDGQKIAHTINPRTGRPVQHSILSSTVWAPTCAMADAFATAFMVLGVDSAKAVLTAQPQLKAYFIYSDCDGNQQEWTNREM